MCYAEEICNEKCIKIHWVPPLPINSASKWIKDFLIKSKINQQ